jgi:hypothetical protein
MKAYNETQREVIYAALDVDPMALAIMGLLQDRLRWSGTVGDLLRDISDKLSMYGSPFQGRTPRWLSNQISRVAPSMRKVGISIEREARRHKSSSAKLVVIKRIKVGTCPMCPQDVSTSPVSDISGTHLEYEAEGRVPDVSHEDEADQEVSEGTEGVQGGEPEALACVKM